MASHLAAWLRLSLTPGVGGATIRALLGAFGTPEDALNAAEADLVAVIGPTLARAVRVGPDAALLEHSNAWIDQDRCAILTLDDERYPARLRVIADAPPLLYVRGDPALLSVPSIAIVGARNPTPQGIENARQFARALSEAGLAVCSGLAIGIDTAAHEGALAEKAGTVAVLGTGVDRCYPRSNVKLAQRIVDQGAVISEFPLGMLPLPANFPRRNRIISGLALGCLVVEASLESGSLITARQAADQGREVFAIPGSIHAPTAKGCHALIKQGAKLVETVEDVLEELRWERPGQMPLTLPIVPPSPLEAAMGFEPVYLDTLCARVGLTPDVVSAMLLELELQGRVATLPGGQYQRIC